MQHVSSLAIDVAVCFKLPALCICVAGFPSPKSNVRLHWAKLGPRWRQKVTSNGSPTAALGNLFLKCGLSSFSTMLMVCEMMVSDNGCHNCTLTRRTVARLKIRSDIECDLLSKFVLVWQDISKLQITSGFSLFTLFIFLMIDSTFLEIL